jgi:hypothetical protein
VDRRVPRYVFRYDGKDSAKRFRRTVKIARNAHGYYGELVRRYDRYGYARRVHRITTLQLRRRANTVAAPHHIAPVRQNAPIAADVRTLAREKNAARGDHAKDDSLDGEEEKKRRRHHCSEDRCHVTLAHGHQHARRHARMSLEPWRER